MAPLRWISERRNAFLADREMRDRVEGDLLPGLNALRAIAALMVVLGHVELLKSQRGIPSAFNTPGSWLPDGHLGVVLFFALSGYLITFLLVKERAAIGRTDLRKFYMRRILRIWPLYYTVLLLSVVLFPFTPGTGTWLFSVLGMPNIGHALRMDWLPSPQVWSIGVEEQFYLFWPVILRFLPPARVIPALLVFFIGYALLPYGVDFLNSRTLKDPELYHASALFFHGTRFDCMAMGCLFGYMRATDHSFVTKLNGRSIGWASIGLTALCWFGGVHFDRFNDPIYAILFCMVILNLSGPIRVFPDPDRTVLGPIGKISYGIYMYHWMIILFVLDLVPYGSIANDLVYNVVVHTLAFGGTLALSWISFNTLERYFLQKKARFRVLKT